MDAEAHAVEAKQTGTQRGEKSGLLNVVVLT